MTNKELYKELCEHACSCDLLYGWFCYFCRELKSELEKALIPRRKKVSKRRFMKCTKHPKYQAKRYPRSECKMCLQLWNFKQANQRFWDEIDRKFVEKFMNAGPDYGESNGELNAKSRSS